MYELDPPSFASHYPGGLPGRGSVAESRITAMSWNDRSDPRCSPHPFDILAIYALYQSR